MWLPLTRNSCWVRPWAQHVVHIISFNPHTIPVQRWDEGGSARPLSRDTRLVNIWIRRTQIFETKAHFLSFFLNTYFHSFIYLAAPGLSYSTWNHSLWQNGIFKLEHVGSRSLTRDWTQTPCTGNAILATWPPGKSPLALSSPLFCFPMCSTQQDN